MEMSNREREIGLGWDEAEAKEIIDHAEFSKIKESNETKQINRDSNYKLMSIDRESWIIKEDEMGIPEKIFGFDDYNLGDHYVNIRPNDLERLLDSKLEISLTRVSDDKNMFLDIIGIKIGNINSRITVYDFLDNPELINKFSPENQAIIDKALNDYSDKQKKEEKENQQIAALSNYQEILGINNQIDELTKSINQLTSNRVLLQTILLSETELFLDGKYLENPNLLSSSCVYAYSQDGLGRYYYAHADNVNNGYWDKCFGSEKTAVQTIPRELAKKLLIYSGHYAKAIKEQLAKQKQILSAALTSALEQLDFTMSSKDLMDKISWLDYHAKTDKN